MTEIYIITLLGSCLLCYLAERVAVYDENNNKKMNAMVYMLMIFFIIVLGFRYMNYLYSDEWVYRNSARNGDYSILDVLQPEGINTIIMWLSVIFSNSLGGAFAYGQFYILATSCIVSILFVKSMWDYSEDFTFSVFLFVSMWFAFTSMNIVRQFVAAAILYYGMRYIKKGEIGKYVIIVLIAFGFHSSAIIMLPLYFVCRMKKIAGKTWIMVIISFLLLNKVTEIGNLLFEENKYSLYLGDFLAYSVNPLRLLSIAIPATFILIYRERFFLKNNNIICEVNMMMLVLIVTVFSTKSVVYNRMNYYFATACLNIFPQIPNQFTESSRRIMKFLMIVLFFLFGLYQAKISQTYHNILFENISGILK